jgi:hypothetical protein
MPPPSGRGVSIPPQEGEKIYTLLYEMDQRLTLERKEDRKEVEDLKIRTEAVERSVSSNIVTSQAVQQLTEKVTASLAIHGHEIGQLKAAHDAGKAAGGKAGLSMGAIGTALVTIIIYVAQLLQQQGPPPVVPRHEKVAPAPLMPFGP